MSTAPVFIKLTQADNTPAFINPVHITGMSRDFAWTTRIYMFDGPDEHGTRYEVTETPEEIIEIIAEAYSEPE